MQIRVESRMASAHDCRGMLLAGALFLLASVSPAQAEPHQPQASVTGQPVPLDMVDLRYPLPVDEMLPRLDSARVVYIGEQHDRYGHHLAQLELIRQLHQRNPNLAIGMEMFQRPFQEHLDAWLAGEIDEREMLRRTEWYERWKFDYRLYRPILAYAREHGIPVLALNAPVELTRRISAVGIDGLDTKERERIPFQIDRSDKAYEQRLRATFESHPPSTSRKFERFIDVQLTWDESMAEAAAGYLARNPQSRLVVLAGTGHLSYGAGIPRRAARRVDHEYAIVLPADGIQVEPWIADFLVFPVNATLPAAGMLGVSIDDSATQGVRIEVVVPGGAADKAGLRKGDRIAQLDGQAITSYADLRLALLDRRPGDAVSVAVERKRWLRAVKEIAIEVELGG